MMVLNNLLRSLRFFACAATLLAVPAISSAATLTFGPTTFGTFSAGSTGGFSVPQFDPSLGTLVEVDLFVTGNSAGGSNKVENLSDNAGNATVNIGTDITVSGPASLAVLTFPANSNSGPIAIFDGTLDWALNPDVLAVFGTTASDSDSDSITLGLAPYIGLGTVPFTYSSAANTSSSADVAPTASLTSAPTFGFDATVVYTYNPVPEPSSICLLGLALAGFGFVAVRRTKKQ